jgi:hypothetical protein
MISMNGRSEETVKEDAMVILQYYCVAGRFSKITKVNEKNHC